jgi:hypothetical protein
MACDHSDTHSGAIRYLRQDAQLLLVVVCDRCGAECTELGRIDYQPAWASAATGAHGADTAA